MESQLESKSTAEIILLLPAIVRVGEVRVSLDMEIDLYSIEDPELCVYTEEQELGYEVYPCPEKGEVMNVSLHLESIWKRNQNIKNLLLHGDEEGIYPNNAELTTPCPVNKKQLATYDDVEV